MNRSVSVIIASLVSCLATLFVINHWDTSSVHVFRYPSQILHEFSGPSRNFFEPNRVLTHPPARRPVRTADVDCSDDYDVCGEGFYCCNGRCYNAVYVELTFVADDMGELYICQQHGYNSVARTEHYQQIGKYKDWMPCTEAYLKITNTHLEGGATILILGDNIYGASGTKWLPIESEPDWSHVFHPVERFYAIAGVSPYREYAKYWGAYPVTDSVNSSAYTMNFKFTPAGCESHHL